MVTMLTAYGVRPMMFRLPAVAVIPCAAKSSRPMMTMDTSIVTIER